MSCGVRVGDDPVLPVLQDPLCRAGQRDRADRPQGALRQLPVQLGAGSGAARSEDGGSARPLPTPPAPAPRGEPASPAAAALASRAEPEPSPMSASTAIAAAAQSAPGSGRSSRSAAALLMIAAVVAIQIFGLPDIGQRFGIPVRTVNALTISGQAERRGWRAATSCSTVRGEIINQTDEVQRVPQIRAELNDGRAASSTPGRSRRRCASCRRAAGSPSTAPRWTFRAGAAT